MHVYLLKEPTIILNTAAQGAAVKNTNKKVAFKNSAPFTSCITEMNNPQVDNTDNINTVMPMYNLIEYSNAYSKKSGSLWQYYRDEPTLGNNDNIIDIPANDNKQEKHETAAQMMLK